MNNACRGDRIQARLFKISKDDTVKGLQAMNESVTFKDSAVATELEKVSFHFNPKEGQ